MIEQDSERAVPWFYYEQFGFSKAPPLTDSHVVRNMALALMLAASGDGTLSESERQWILGYFAVKGYPRHVIDEVAAMAKRDLSRLPHLMDLGILRDSGRILVYDAIRASSIDGYGAGEHEAVRQAAALLGIDEASVVAMEALVSDERALKQRRIALLMPDGHPNLDQGYQR
jgi:hypothetical protein